MQIAHPVNKNVAILNRVFTLASVPDAASIKINFQDGSTQVPSGWFADIGEPFSSHAGSYQGAELMYGWKSKETGKPMSLEGNGRARPEPEDVLLSTFIHMQANDISSLRYGRFNGVKAEGYWELKVLNGVYKVMVAVGDGAVNKADEVDCINIEGVRAISDFTPMGKLRSPGRFKSSEVTVNVNDGYLTVDAGGGINTKICYIQIEPVNLLPYVYMVPEKQSLLFKKNGVNSSSFSIGMHNSENIKTKYTLTAVYTGSAKNWMSFTPAGVGGDSVYTLDYSEAKKLDEGIYYADITASSPGFTAFTVNVQLRIVNDGKPYIISSNLINGSCAASIINIAANNIFVPAVPGMKGGTNNTTITGKTVRLFKVTYNREENVPGVVQGTGGGDAISFSPARPLEANSNYKFIVTGGVKSYSGASFFPYECSFSTGGAAIDSGNIINASFTKIAMPGTQNKKYTSLLFGPDAKLYALKINGEIERFNVDHTSGMLSGLKIINTLIKKRGESTAIGLTFDKASTAQNLVAWVSYSSSGLSEAPMFDGKISRLSGPELENEEQVIINLPRSTRDHMVNSLVFGPDGALYISQGSNSSAGNFDKGWQREETLLAGAILRLDVAKLTNIKLPLDVKTTSKQRLINTAPATILTMADGSYNPYSVNSPLTIYASGIRNGYDMVWHSNGQLYVPANGSGGGGNSPASVNGTRRPDGTFYNGPTVVSTQNVPVQRDWLFRINPARNVGYYGHPNPLRGEYVINRGYTDNPMYSQSVKTDINYRKPAFDFGFNKSPNGVIEYKSNTFNGALKGKLLVCRFSGGGDIMVLEPGALSKVPLHDLNKDQIYDIVKSAGGSGNYGLHGMAGFANPLDLVEDITNGNIYLSEFNWNDNPNLISQITLLKVVQKSGDSPKNTSATISKR
ncbi:PQQ-dependent sugar dehydrogenase [Mucilaginibacter celer]|uniref:PQQ-dependent sugar dehydrogenase n=1 Tax=Mucilaginibacter celer TaxID=2305508 RepID=UPI0013CEB8B8|nr:PQQ-dependent sugar dehydrogenase [Mucilaginibacter celer]